MTTLHSTHPIISQLPESLRPPMHCPTCSTELVALDAWVFCPNFHCPYRIYGRLQKFVDVLGILNVGEGALMQMTKLGIIKTPADLYRVTEQQFCDLERKGSKHYAKFKAGLEFTRTMSTAQFFASLDIEGLGTWDNITAVPGLQTLDQVLTAVAQQKYGLISNAVRVSPEKAKFICQEITDRMDEVNALRAQVQFKTKGDIMMGKTICITGSLTTGTRPQIEQMVKDAGGMVSSSVSSRTSHLCTNDSTSGSSKNTAANRLGIPIISEAQLLQMMGKTP